MPTGVFYIEQDAATNAVRIAGDNMGPEGSDRFAPGAAGLLPGRVRRRHRLRQCARLRPARPRRQHALRTVGIESVATALGRFAAWKAPDQFDQRAVRQRRGLRLMAPALGAPLRFEMVATGPDGSRLQTAAVLRATSRALA